MTIEDLIKDVLDLDAKATKGPWKSKALLDGSDAVDSTFITDPNYKYFLDERPWLNIIAIIDRDNLNTRHIDGARWGEQQDFNREYIMHARTSAPKLARACQVLLDAFPEIPKQSDHIGLQLDHKDVASMREALAEVDKIAGEG